MFYTKYHLRKRDFLFLKFKYVLLVITLCIFYQNVFAQLKAGVEEIDITPPIDGPMAGYSTRGENVSKGIHDRLYAEALVLDDGSTKLAIVSIDLIGIVKESTENIKAMVRDRTGIDHILIVASHTHSGPAHWSQDIERKIAEAIVQANRNLKPARMGVGVGEVREGHNRRMIRTDGSLMMFWRNRNRIPTNPVDYQLGVIRIEGSDGPIATLVNFTCHPVVAGPENLLYSADYPGAMKRMVKNEIGGEVMYLSGSSGDINPFWDKTPPNEGAFEQIEKMGRAIADEVLKVSNHIIDYKETPKVSFKNEVILLASRQDIARSERNIQAEINTVLIGKELAIATFPGEFFCQTRTVTQRAQPL